MKKRWAFLIFAIAVVILVSNTRAQGNGDNETECFDEIDNDGDNLIDFPDDPGCDDVDDNNETDIVEDDGAPVLDTTGAEIIRHTVNPSIELIFSEPIELISAYLYAVNEETAAMMAIGLNPPPIPVDIIELTDGITARPLMNLFNGLYDFVVTVQDVVENVAIVHQKFIIDMPGTDIKIITPRLGVSDGAATDLVIETTRYNSPENTLCKITTSPFVYFFNSSALVPFEIPLVLDSTHNFTDFFTNANFANSAVFYILCEDATLNRVNRERFEIYVDLIPPGISIFNFEPPKVVEYPEFEDKLAVNLNITANEPVLCKYSINESKEYGAMTNFPDFDKNDFDAYTRKNNTVKVYLADAPLASYDFYVQCEDRAGLKTSVVKKTLQVDLAAGLGINIIEPKPFTTNTSITLRLTTVKRAACLVGETSNDYSMMNSDVAGKMHTYYLGQFDDGEYTYMIKCTSQAVGGLYVQEQEISYTFTIDNTPPSAPNSTGSTTTCFSYKFFFVPSITLASVDSGSGIAHYLYKMDTSSGLILNWTKTRNDIDEIDEDYRGDDINLSQTASYRLIAKAVNGAGIESSETTITILYNPDDIICYEKDPPIIIIATNETEGKTKVTIYCEDESGCDNESYYYGLCDTDSCEPTTQLDYPFTLDVFDTKYLAYNVSDIHGYSATGTEMIEVEEGRTCNNGLTDGDETDIDCGGSCQGCDIGEGCEVNTDCSGNFCNENICTETACDDSYKNGPYGNEETDVDCGGYCGATCSSNQTCNNGGDCESGFCTPDDVCQIPSCDDGYKNGNETDVDCGGDCSVKCNDKDGDGIDDDWEERYCNGDCDPNDDMDDDDLTNIEEFMMGTDPTKKDTDDDGCFDGDEVTAGTDPKYAGDCSSGGILGIMFLLLGILLMGGGIGYLVYKKYYVEKSAKKAQAIAPGTAAAMAMLPQQTAEERRRMAEQQRKAMEQRRKQLEERHKKLSALRERITQRRKSLEEKKREERKNLFKKFGMMARPKPAVPKPKITAKAAPPIKPRPELKKGADGWVSFDRLKEKFSKVAKPAAEEKLKKAEGKLAASRKTEFGKLEELAGKKQAAKAKKGDKKGDVFEELEKSIAGKGVIEKEKDIYKKLGEVSGKKKIKKDKSH